MEKEQVNKFHVSGKVKEVNASILTPHNAGLRLILFPINMAGKTVHPVFDTFDKKWKTIKGESRGWYTNKNGFYKLGSVNTVLCNSDVWALGMLCQDEKLEINQDALKSCLKKVAETALYEKASVHVPKEMVDTFPGLKDLCGEYLTNKGVSVYYYNL